MWTGGNQPKTLNFDYMHEKLDVEGSSNQLNINGLFLKCLWKHGHPPGPIKLLTMFIKLYIWNCGYKLLVYVND